MTNKCPHLYSSAHPSECVPCLQEENARLKREKIGYRSLAIKLHIEFDCPGFETRCEEVIDREAERLAKESK